MSEIVFGTVVFCDDGDCPHNFHGKCVTDILDMSEKRCMTGLSHDEDVRGLPAKATRKGS